MEVTGDVPEIGTHARPVALVDVLAEVTAAGVTVADHLDRTLLDDRAFRGESASSWAWPWTR